MITLSLTGNERLQFQYILPVQGSLKALELVESILDRVKIDDIKDINGNDSIKKIELEEKEIMFLREMISVLDQSQKLSFQSLSLIKKIMNIKGDKSI